MAKIKRKHPSNSRIENYFDYIIGTKGRAYIRFDTLLLSILYGKDTFSGQEVKLFLWIYRNTVGWQENKVRHNVSRIVRETGITRSWIYKCLRKFIAGQWITIKQDDSGNKYIYMDVMTLEHVAIKKLLEDNKNAEDDKLKEALKAAEERELSDIENEAQHREIDEWEEYSEWYYKQYEDWVDSQQE